MKHNGHKVTRRGVRPLGQTERIAHYEALLQELERIVSGGTETAGEEQTARALADALDAYYTSDDWKRDYAADEAGLLPRGLRRGVLSEDGIYNALEAFREWLEDCGAACEREEP